MKVQPKNWLLQNNKLCFLFKNKMGVLLILFFVNVNCTKSQIANYVNNGGFEVPNSTNMQLPKYWNAIDSNKFMGILLSEVISPFLVPSSSYTYQWPRHGKNFLIGTEYFTTCPNQTCVGYPRNKLKQTLQSGKTYCFKMYVNLSNQSSYAIDALGVYFSDISSDTITYCTLPITYLMPQIENPVGNIISDTLNWTLISGTYTAIGTEKYIIIGNFKTDANTNKTMVNPANLPAHFSDYCYDDVSVIDVDLPAYTGPDIWGIPTNTVYLGRPQDVGIDEACMWYHLPNTTTAIDTAAGITVTVAATTQTYMVKQDICGNIKYDTVVVFASGVGLTPLSFGEGMGVRLYPNPATSNITIEFGQLKEQELQLYISDLPGKIVREEELKIKGVNERINLDLDLKAGIYFVIIKNKNNESITKKLVIAD